MGTVIILISFRGIQLATICNIPVFSSKMKKEMQTGPYIVQNG